MSLQRIRELNEQIARMNEGILQPLRVALRDAKGEAEIRTAKANVDKALDDMDKLVAERDVVQADLNRNSRFALVDASGRTESEIRNIPGDKKSSVAAYNRALKRFGVTVTRDSRGEFVTRNHALEQVTSQVRMVIEEMEERYWQAFVRCSQKDGGTAEARAIVMGNDPEFRDMGIGTNTLGGYFVPTGFVYEIEEAMKWYGSMLMSSSILDTATGQPLPYPTSNDTGTTGEIVGEGKQVSAADVTVGQIQFGAYKFSTKMTKVSLELVQDSAFDVKGFLIKMFAIRLGRILNTKFTVGAGSTEPTGLVTAVVANCVAAQLASAGVAYGTAVLAQGSGGNTGGAETGGTSIGSQDLTDLEHTVDPAYRPGSSYMFHDQTLRVVKRLLDKYGHPLWKQTMTAGEPDRLNNYPYFINNDIATIAVNAKTVLFGDLKKYLVRRVKELGVLTLNERFADYGQVAYIGFARYDGNLLDAGTHPVCFLQQAAA